METIGCPGLELACLELSELNQHTVAIIGETALSGVPSAKHLDTDKGLMSAVLSTHPSLTLQRKQVLHY